MAVNTIAQACAITFKGNVDRNRQQDAFFFIDNCFQEDIGVTEVVAKQLPLCLAVSDGVSSSMYSHVCSKAVVKAVKALIEKKQALNASNIDKIINRTTHKISHHGAAATLAMLEVEYGDNGAVLGKITHVGDSRVYKLSKGSNQWTCLTRDHTLLNEFIDLNLLKKREQPTCSDYSQTSMQDVLCGITEYFSLVTEDVDGFTAPNSKVSRVIIEPGDSLVVCTDGVYDQASSDQWELIDSSTDLQEWLLALETQVYRSESSDNGTAIVVRFDLLH